MFTIFTIPKAFHGHIGIIQTNAIRSWVLLHPECEVILLGNDEGTAEIALQLGIRHISEVESNEYGTPLISSIFGIAQDIASHQLVCYVNADIILMSDFLKAVRQVQRRPFLLVGQRWDLDLKKPVDFDKPDWESYLQARVAEQGKLHPSTGIDYFAFPRGLYRNVPPFAVGRGGWDNWLIYQARHLKVPVIDATKAVIAIHQNHDYAHHPGGKAGVWKGPEIKRNIELMGGIDHGLTLNYATFLLTPRGIRRALTLRHLYFRIRAIPMLYSRLRFLNVAARALLKLIKV